MLMCAPSNYSVIKSKAACSLTRETLLTAVLAVFGIEESIFLSNYRGRAYADARKVFMYLGTRYLDFSKNKLSKFINRDHSTGIAQLAAADALMRNDIDFKTKLEQVKTKIFSK